VLATLENMKRLKKKSIFVLWPSQKTVLYFFPKFTLEETLREDKKKLS
jgi:hypothetical protein